MSEAVAELRALLQKPQAGLRLVHLHLGRLENPLVVDRKAARSVLRELGKKADAWRLFDMPNGDLLFLYQGLAWTSVEAGCKEIAAMASTSPLTGANPYGTQPEMLFDIMELPSNAGRVLTYLENVGDAGAPPPSTH